VLSTWEWLMKITTTTMPEKKKVESVFDWGRLRHPHLDVSVPGYPGGSLERAVYFGWVWEPKDAFDITVAMRSDDAEVNLSLWNVGGDGPGMEDARKAICGGLHLFWRRRLTIEASQWYQAEKTDDEEQNKQNVQGLQDCIRRCSALTWWAWDDGSRLLFWRWPPIWHRVTVLAMASHLVPRGKGRSRGFSAW